MVDDSLLDTRDTWRRSATISPEHVQELQSRLQRAVDIQTSIFPFKGMTLTRADVEWLLLNHDHGRGPVIWSDVSQPERRGLDLRGANLAGEDLSNLPLAGLLGGLTTEERLIASKHARSEELR